MDPTNYLINHILPFSGVSFLLLDPCVFPVPLCIFFWVPTANMENACHIYTRTSRKLTAVRINFPRPVTVKHVYTSEVDPKFRLASFGGNIFCLRFLVLNTRYNPEGHSLTILWSPTVWRTTWRTRGILSLSGLMLICTQSVAHVNLGVLPAARAERQMAGAVSWL